MIDLKRCYDILDIPLEASVEEINKQYRDLVNIWHPDRFEGKPRLQKKASVKLVEINAAYDQLREYLQTKNTVTTIRGQAGKCSNDSGGEKKEKATADTSCGNEQSFMQGKQWAEAKPRRSRIWTFLCLVILALLASPLFIIPKVKEKFPFFDDPAEYLKTSVKTAITEILSEPPKTINTQQGIPVPKSVAEKPTPPKMKPLVEIRLDCGSVIMAISYRIEGEMLVYQLDHGWVGVPRKSVKSIKAIKGATE